MSERPTPVTDAFREVVFAQYKEDELTGNGMGNILAALPDIELLERERDEAREKAERYRLEANAIMLQRDEALMDRANGDIATMTINHYERILRERDEWTAMCGRYKQERDELLQKLDAWKEISELLHHFVNYPANGVEQAIQRVEVLEAYKHLSNEKTKRR